MDDIEGALGQLSQQNSKDLTIIVDYSIRGYSRTITAADIGRVEERPPTRQYFSKCIQVYPPE